MEPASPGTPAPPSDVLLVEDDPIIALDFEDTIIGLGVKTVRTAATVARALQMIADRAPDFALLDVSLGRETSLAVAALTRKLFVVYLQGVVVFLTYLVVNAVFANTNSLEHFWSAIFDPVGMRLFESVTRYWTVAEKNTLQLPWSGVFLYNRLIWTGVGLLSLITTYLLFPFSVEALTARSHGRRAARDRNHDSAEADDRKLLAGLAQRSACDLLRGAGRGKPRTCRGSSSEGALLQKITTLHGWDPPQGNLWTA